MQRRAHVAGLDARRSGVPGRARSRARCQQAGRSAQVQQAVRVAGLDGRIQHHAGILAQRDGQVVAIEQGDAARMPGTRPPSSNTRWSASRATSSIAWVTCHRDAGPGARPPGRAGSPRAGPHPARPAVRRAAAAAARSPAHGRRRDTLAFAAGQGIRPPVQQRARSRRSIQVASRSAGCAGALPAVKRRLPSTLRCGSRRRCWNTTPTARRCGGGNAAPRPARPRRHPDAAARARFQPRRWRATGFCRSPTGRTRPSCGWQRCGVDVQPERPARQGEPDLDGMRGLSHRPPPCIAQPLHQQQQHEQNMSSPAASAWASSWPSLPPGRVQQDRQDPGLASMLPPTISTTPNSPTVCASGEVSWRSPAAGRERKAAPRSGSDPAALRARWRRPPACWPGSPPKPGLQRMHHRTAASTAGKRTGCPRR